MSLHRILRPKGSIVSAMCGGLVWLAAAAALADTTVLVGTGRLNNQSTTVAGALTRYSVSGTTWTLLDPDFNSDSWDQTIATGVGGLTQDIYGNVYAAVNTGENDTRGIRIYRQTGGESVGYLNSTWGLGNLTGNSPDGLTLGPNGQLYATIAFGTGNNKLLSFNTTTLSSGQIQLGQGGTNTGLTDTGTAGLSTPRGITVASDGNFYLANRGSRQILRWTGSGTTASVVATNNTESANYQAVSWDAAGNRLLTNTQTGLVGSLTLTGTGSDNSLSSQTDSTNGVGVLAVEGQVAFTNFGNPGADQTGRLARASGVPSTPTEIATGLNAPGGMLVLRDTRLWGGGTGSWNTGGNWQQGIGGSTGAATFTDGTGATSLPSVLTFTGTAGGTATNDVAGTVNVGGLNFAPDAGAYTLAGNAFTLGLNANIRNLSTNAQAISADIALAGSQWIYGETGSTLTISGRISGAGTKLTKLGAGGLVLSGTNSFDGGIDVTAGRLLVDGLLASGVSLASGALLGGSGSIPSLSVAADGLLAFDPASAGLLLPEGDNVTLPATFGVDDLRTPAGGAINWASITPGTYTLLAGTTTDFSGINNFGEENAFVSGDRSVYFENGSLQLVVVPEPAGLALAGIGLAAAAAARRRRS